MNTSLHLRPKRKTQNTQRPTFSKQTPATVPGGGGRRQTRRNLGVPRPPRLSTNGLYAETQRWVCKARSPDRGDC